MPELKPSEVSEILKMQIAGMKNKLEFDEIGTVLNVGDGVARVFGLNNVQSNELIVFEDGTKGIVLNLEEDNVGAVLLGSSENVKEGFTV